MTTLEIITEFQEQIDEERSYTIKELKQILTEVYKTKTGKTKITAKTAKTTKTDDSDNTNDDSDDDKPRKRGRPAKVKLDKDGNPKQKRAPSAYNLFIRDKIKELKAENPDVDAKELMKMASVEWKELSQEEKDELKNNM